MMLQAVSKLLFGGDAQTTQWGIECWELGESLFEMRLNGGKPVKVLAIQGNISAGPLPHANTANGFVRQTLLSLTYGGKRKPNNAEVISSPEHRRNNHNVSRNLAGFNIKSVGGQVVHLPVNRVFFASHALSDGVLRMKCHNASYDGKKPTTDARECLNIELHLSVYWRPIIAA